MEEVKKRPRIKVLRKKGTAYESINWSYSDTTLRKRKRLHGMHPAWHVTAGTIQIDLAKGFDATSFSTEKVDAELLARFIGKLVNEYYVNGIVFTESIRKQIISETMDFITKMRDCYERL